LQVGTTSDVETKMKRVEHVIACLIDKNGS
jgi:hypothetical protein